MRVPGRTDTGRRLAGLRLYDVAPTILDLYGIPVPPEMQGRVIR
jgi:predicted AlkP superfamily phosphohydrolase/phosphomutase